MPPSIPASLLKAVSSIHPSRHHPPPPFIYGNSPHPITLRPSTYSPSYSHLIARSSATRNSLFAVSANRLGKRGLSWMRPGSRGGERSLGARKRAAVAPDLGGGAAMGSGSGSGAEYQNGKGEVENDGGFKGQRSMRLLTIPTVLTIGRVAAVPLLVSTFYMNGRWATTATTSIFLAAAITDWLDGYIARKMQLGTAFGAFLDPVADKLMVAATLVLLCTRPLEGALFAQVPWILTVPSIAIIGREITMSAVREWAASQNSKVLEAVAVNNLGKWKTATQMTSLIILLAARDSSLTGTDGIVASGVFLLYISAGLAVWSLIVYMRKIWRVLLK
ncbi:CDP-diacylglycerol--glycerol-3-phosphate 3-phosphatidyltransferase 2-like [Typha angustifolia]|uniref:CDP-diacylglycerol--glycerol-3-phosphate 3-phosphatidyltransferase 2-like n=1 Tax=Typha angustifolia TaxID=59011 RepID=UPI003C2EA170